MPTATPTKDDRLTVRFDTVTATAFPARGRNALQPFGTVLSYVEQPGTTPTGGRYTRRQFKFRAPGGRVWFGTLPKDNPRPVVRMRPAS